MSGLRLRGRLTLMSAVIVGAVLVVGSIIAYVVVGNALRGQVDEQLRTQSRGVARFAGGLPGGPGPVGQGTFESEREGEPERFRDPELGTREGGPLQLAQFVTARGAILRLPRRNEEVRIPVTAADHALARRGAGSSFTNRTDDGTRLRVLTVAAPGGIGAFQIAQPLASVDDALEDLRLVLVLLVLGGTALAALLARAFSRRVLEPVTALTSAAEHIEATGDLGRRIEPGSDDEVGRMASSFNAMLDRVASSVEAQRQLVADASHELRTPVTALRTNVEVLAERGADLDDVQRQALLADVVAQSDELGVVVADVIELARGEDAVSAVEDVRLDELVRDAVARMRRHAPAVAVDVHAEPCVVSGAPDRLARAVNNLLDNAAKYGPPDGPVAVDLERRPDGIAALTVRDHGPGVNPAEARQIFDRFTRGAVARAHAGSGLGLAIVRQVARAHGGSVSVEAAPGGGARFVLLLGGASAPEA